MLWGPGPRGTPLNPGDTIRARGLQPEQLSSKGRGRVCRAGVDLCAPSATGTLTVDNTCPASTRRALERLKNHIQSSLLVWESSSSQNRTQTRVPRQALTVPAQEEPAHPSTCQGHGTKIPRPSLIPSTEHADASNRTNLFCLRNTNHLLCTPSF